MKRSLLCWLACLLLTGTCSLPVVRADSSDTPDKVGRVSYDDTSAPSTGKERGPPAVQYCFAFVSAILVLLILCTPTRKRHIANR